MYRAWSSSCLADIVGWLTFFSNTDALQTLQNRIFLGKRARPPFFWCCFPAESQGKNGRYINGHSIIQIHVHVVMSESIYIKSLTCICIDLRYVSFFDLVLGSVAMR